MDAEGFIRCKKLINGRLLLWPPCVHGFARSRCVSPMWPNFLPGSQLPVSVPGEQWTLVPSWFNPGPTARPLARHWTSLCRSCHLATFSTGCMEHYAIPFCVSASASSGASGADFMREDIISRHKKRRFRVTSTVLDTSPWQIIGDLLKPLACEEPPKSPPWY